MYHTRSTNGSTPEFICHGDRLLVSAHQEGAPALTGNMDIEEYIPGKGWVVRQNFTAASVTPTELQAGANGPTRWRATTKSQSTGVWGVAFR